MTSIFVTFHMCDNWYPTCTLHMQKRNEKKSKPDQEIIQSTVTIFCVVKSVIENQSKCLTCK